MFPIPRDFSATVISSGHHRRLPLPGHDNAVATYYPQVDFLHFRTNGQSPDNTTVSELDSNWSFADPIELDIDTIANSEASAVGGLTTPDILEYIGLDVNHISHHELGHSILSETTAKSNPSLFINIAQNQKFAALLHGYAVEPDTLRSESIKLIANESSIAFIENLAAPVHESIATISAAVRSDGSTVSNLQDRIQELNTLVDGRKGWTLRHPGYSPFEHTKKSAKNEWVQFLRSYEFTILSAVTPLFVAFDEVLIVSLLTAAATASIRAPAADPESITDEIHHLLPSISFFDGVMQLQNAAQFYGHLFANGASISSLAGMYEENVAQGGEGVDLPGENYEEYFQVLGKQFGSSSGRAYYELVHNSVNNLPFPSYVLHEDASEKSIQVYYFSEGLGPSVLSMTLLRWIFLESIYTGKPQFLNKQYSKIMKQLLKHSYDFPNNATDVLKRATYLAERSVQEFDRQELGRNVEEYYNNHTGIGWQDITNELGAGMYPTATKRHISNNSPSELLAARVSGRPYRGEIFSTGIGRYVEFWGYAYQNPTIDSFAKQVEVIQNISETSPHTPRLNSVYQAFADWVTDKDDSQGLIAQLFGRVLCTGIFADMNDETQWAMRYYTDYLRWSQYTDDFETAIDTLLRACILTILRRSARQDDFEQAKAAIASLVHLLFSEWDESVYNSDEVAAAIRSSVTAIFSEFASDQENRNKALEAFTTGVLIGVKNLEHHPPLKKFVNGVVAGFAGIIRYGSPTELRSEYLKIKPFITGLAEIGLAEDIWNCYACQFPELVVDVADYNRAKEWLRQESSLLANRVGDSSTSTAFSQEMTESVNWELILSNFYTKTLTALIRHHHPTTCDDLFMWTFDHARGNLSPRRLRPVFVISSLSIVQEYQPSHTGIEWWKKIEDAVTKWTPSANKNLEYISLFGEMLAKFEVEGMADRPWQLRVRELMQSIAEKWDLTLDVQMAAFGFATAKVARDGKFEYVGSSEEVNHLRGHAVRYLESNTESDSVLAAGLEHYEAATISHHTLFADRHIAHESLEKLLSVSTINLDRINDKTSLAAVLGEGAGEIYERANVASVNSPFKWINMVEVIAREKSSQAISRPKFVSTYLGSMLVSHLNGLEVNPETADTHVKYIERAITRWEHCPEINPKVLECAVFVYAITRIDHSCKGEQRSGWLRHLCRIAVTSIDPATWKRYKQKRTKYESGETIDCNSSVRILDAFLT